MEGVRISKICALARAFAGYLDDVPTCLPRWNLRLARAPPTTETFSICSPAFIMAYAPAIMAWASAAFGNESTKRHWTAAPAALDPVPPGLAGRIRLSAVGDILRRCEETWVRRLGETLGVFELPAKESWCGLQRAPTAACPVSGKTKPSLSYAVSDLHHSILQHANGGDIIEFCALFLVPKKENLSRVVTDCRRLNARCAKPPHLAFAPIRDIFRILAFFPRAFIVTADFRHWFYQIPLDRRFRNCFGVTCGNMRLARLRVWAMGFAWSPFVAQGLSMSLLREAIETSHEDVTLVRPAQRWYALTPRGTSADAPPPFWIITTTLPPPGQEPFTEDVVGFGLFWYDNLLLVTRSEAAQVRATQSLLRVTDEVNALWKDTKAPTPSHVTTPPAIDPRLFTASEDRAEFLGLSFTRDTVSKVWSWQHVAANTAEWATLKQGGRTWRLAAAVCGVLTWDWSVQGSTRDSMEAVFTVAHKVGKHMLHREAWDELTGPHLSDSDWQHLFARLTTVCESPARPHLFNVNRPQNGFIFSATDAMNGYGAMMAWREDHSWVIPPTRVRFTTEQRARHINWKETHMGLLLMETLLPITPHCCFYGLAVDNTTAEAVLEAQHNPSHPDLHARGLRVMGTVRDRGSFLSTCHIPGIMQPADEPSRGQETSMDKVYECTQWLLRNHGQWWNFPSRAMNRIAGRKRPRTRNGQDQETRWQDPRKR